MPTTPPSLPTYETPADWSDWISPSATRAWLLGDPIADWLKAHGAAKGYVADDKRPGYDGTLEFGSFLLERGIAFEAGVMRCLDELLVARGFEPSRSIADSWRASRSPECAAETVAAMAAGTPVIAQAVLWDPGRRLYGMPDLLVRSDVLATLFPDDLPMERAVGPEHGARAIGLADRHYRVVDIKFTTLSLARDDAAASDHLTYMGQVWLYNRMLERATGFLAPAGFLLGRRWRQGSGANETRGDSCFERLARVDDDRIVKFHGDEEELGVLATRAVEWVRRVRREGAGWNAVPTPSVPELYPTMREDQFPWNGAKKEIAEQIEELTILPRVRPATRAIAHAAGVTSWRDPRASAELFGLAGANAEQFSRIAEANRSPVPVVLPAGRFARTDDRWREHAPFECYVDYETVSNLNDDFSLLPKTGGLDMIFQIGCGHYDDGRWAFDQWTTDRLTLEEERRIIEAWLHHLRERAEAAGVHLRDGRIFHWSPAETATLGRTYERAVERFPEMHWPEHLPWYDLLERIARGEPIGVTGAFGFGLKAIAKSMKAQGLIETSWGDGPADGMGAMLGAWRCDAEAATTGGSMQELALMREIAAYNEVDCRVMAELLAWLRRER